jgi:hypothetical protein
MHNQCPRLAVNLMLERDAGVDASRVEDVIAFGKQSEFRLVRTSSEQAIADKARAIQAHLDSLPDPDDPASYAPSGELHDLGPSNLEDKDRRAATDQGDLPNEIVRKAPPTLGTDPVFNPAELAHPPGDRPPAAISLNNE